MDGIAVIDQTAYEEATRCPRCKHPGKVTAIKPAPNGTAHVVDCQTATCEWYDTSWVVQVRPDGTIPDRTKDANLGPKLYPAYTPGQEAMARRIIEDIQYHDRGMTDAQIQAEIERNQR